MWKLINKSEPYLFNHTGYPGIQMETVVIQYFFVFHKTFLSVKSTNKSPPSWTLTMGGLWWRKLLSFKTYKVLEQVKVCWCWIVKAKKTEGRNCGFPGPLLASGNDTIVEFTQTMLNTETCIRQQKPACVAVFLRQVSLYWVGISENFPLPLEIFLFYHISSHFHRPLLSPLLSLSSPLLNAETDLRLLWRWQK